jgi:hypothetical protein
MRTGFILFVLIRSVITQTRVRVYTPEQLVLLDLIVQGNFIKPIAAAYLYARAKLDCSR